MSPSLTSAAEPYAGGSYCIFSMLFNADSMNYRRPLSLHAVSFGHDAASSSLRRMAQIALEVQNNAPQDPLLPVAVSIPSSYTEALDTVRVKCLFFHLRGLMWISIRCASQKPS
jgi:hypothetical protein